MAAKTDIECERLLLACETLPENWNVAYGITDSRRRAFLSESGHSDSFFKPNSETAMTVFMLGRLGQWEQARMVNDIQSGATPRNKDGSWSSAFFKRFASPWTSTSPRNSALSRFMAERLALEPNGMADSILLFEVRTFNNAFNGGMTIRNPSFLVVEKKWSRFDALVICPIARILLFIESKVESDGTHGASGYETPQPIRNVETAFFLTTLPDSQYFGWDFRYMLLCPKAAVGVSKECEQFFAGRHDGDLNGYDSYLSDATNTVRICADRAGFREQWQELRATLNKRLAVVHWNEMMDALCKSGFDRKNYLQGLSSIDRHDETIVAATKSRWAAAGVEEG